MFNFRNGTSLAVQQDEFVQLYLKGGHLSLKQIADMEQNLWVSAAAKMAPNNLVIRQWCLIDLFKGTLNKKRVYKMMDLLSYKEAGDLRVWAEGYSYYEYTMDVVKLWISKFETGDDPSSVISYNDLSDIKSLIEKINQGFIRSSYYRSGCWYPAPYGDLRDMPLKPDLQLRHPFSNSLKISIVTLSSVNDSFIYSFVGKPIGLNTHIPKNNYTVRTVKEIPGGFKFYEGYDKKYKNAWEEYKDTFDLKRVKSIPSAF